MSSATKQPSMLSMFEENILCYTQKYYIVYIFAANPKTAFVVFLQSRWKKILKQK